jgi:hypothetical protein
VSFIPKDAYYFSHDSNAKDDPKCVLLIDQLGLEGYGIFWVLIETLRDQPNYKYPLMLIPSLARRYNTTAEKMRTVVCNYGLFAVDEEEFFSLSLMERMRHLEDKREKARLAGKKSAEKRLMLNVGSTDVQQAFNECSATVQQVKESKVKKSKGKESKFTSSHMLLAETLRDEILTNNGNAKIPPSLDDWADCFRLMTDVDKREEIHIRKVIKWCQQDNFWKANILSAKKLREKFDTLFMQMNRTSNKPYSGNSSVDAINDFYRRLNNEPNSQTTDYGRDTETIDISVSEREDYA